MHPYLLKGEKIPQTPEGTLERIKVKFSITIIRYLPHDTNDRIILSIISNGCERSHLHHIFSDYAILPFSRNDDHSK